MNVLKKILIGIGGLIVLFLLVAAVLPGSYRVERAIAINQTPEVVFEHVANLNNWLHWNPWTEIDPAAKNTFTGEIRQVGSAWAWEGTTIGAGSLTIENIEPNERVEFKLVFTAPRAGEAKDCWTFQPINGGTKVVWRNEGALDYPLGRYVGLMLEGSILGPQFEKGLANLARVCEASPARMTTSLVPSEGE